MIIWEENSEWWPEHKDEIDLGCNNDLVIQCLQFYLKIIIIVSVSKPPFPSSYVVQCQKRCLICYNEHWIEYTLTFIPSYGNTSFVYIILAMKNVYQLVVQDNVIDRPFFFFSRTVSNDTINSSFLKTRLFYEMCMHGYGCIWSRKIMNFPLFLWWCLLHHIKYLATNLIVS